MRARQMIYGVAGALGTLAAALAAPPTPPATMTSGQAPASADEPIVTHGTTPAQARHWDLWENYCCQKRREHDPVRHYHPLVRMKYSLLPQRCSCGGHACGHCDGGDYTKPGGEGKTTSQHAGTRPAPQWQPDATAQPLAAQPPVPPVVVEPQTEAETDARPTSPQAEPQPSIPPVDDPATAPGAQPIELAPEQPPVVVPPVADPNRVPRNPLPNNTPPKRRVLPPASQGSSAEPNARAATTLISNRQEAKGHASLGRYIQTK